MHTRSPAAAYSLDGQIDLLIHDCSNQILRAVSFDEGKEWVGWTKLKGKKTRNPVALSCTGDGSTKYIAYRVFDPPAPHPFAKRPDDEGKYILFRSGLYGFDWGGVPAPISGGGRFLSGPSVLASPDPDVVYIFGLGMDSKIYWSKSDDAGGISWLWKWAKIGDGVYKHKPATAMSSDERTIMLFAVGTDDRCYFSRSLDGGATWNPDCAPIKEGLFTSGPSACVSADGRRALVAARGRDDRVYFIRTDDRGASWRGDWSAIHSGVFDGGPGLCASWDLGKAFVFALGRDGKIWKAAARGKNSPFGDWSRVEGLAAV